MSDLINSVANRVQSSCNNIYFLNTTFFNVFYCFIRGIKLGNNNQFFGFAFFKRTVGSTIIIGDNCRFRSTATSNLIGVNHKCIIATHAPGASIKIGNGSGFSGTTIGAFCQITIGDNVKCGANTLITDSDWHADDARSAKPKAVFIDDNVWLGYGAIVMKGVTIGKNSVIGAGSVVTKDIPPNVVAAGNPCKVIKPL